MYHACNSCKPNNFQWNQRQPDRNSTPRGKERRKLPGDRSETVEKMNMERSQGKTKSQQRRAKPEKTYPLNNPEPFPINPTHVKRKRKTHEEKEKDQGEEKNILTPVDATFTRSMSSSCHQLLLLLCGWTEKGTPNSTMASRRG